MYKFAFITLNWLLAIASAIILAYVLYAVGRFLWNLIGSIRDRDWFSTMINALIFLFGVAVLASQVYTFIKIIPKGDASAGHDLTMPF